jgi:phytoene synthase
MMALLMEARGAAALARAADLGTAMQLTNIARDVGEDARAGRIYLPLAWLRDAGLDPEAWLAAPAPRPEIAAATGRLLDRAALLYGQAEAGIALLPAGCRPGIAAARLVYAGIGDGVARQGLDSVSRRAVVPGRRKAWLLARAGVLALRAAPAPDQPPLEANRFLVEAALAAAAPRAPRRPRLLDIAGRLAWLLDLFERLERQERGRRAAADGAAGAVSISP